MKSYRDYEKELNQQDDERPETANCAEINGENGDCPLDRKTCRGCRYNKR